MFKYSSIDKYCDAQCGWVLADHARHSFKSRLRPTLPYSVRLGLQLQLTTVNVELAPTVENMHLIHSRMRLRGGGDDETAHIWAIWGYEGVKELGLMPASSLQYLHNILH